MRRYECMDISRVSGYDSIGIEVIDARASFS